MWYVIHDIFQCHTYRTVLTLSVLFFFAANNCCSWKPVHCQTSGKRPESWQHKSGRVFKKIIILILILIFVVVLQYRVQCIIFLYRWKCGKHWQTLFKGSFSVWKPRRRRFITGYGNARDPWRDVLQDKGLYRTLQIS